MEQLPQPNCPKCSKKMSPAGGYVMTNITTDWACWGCDIRIQDDHAEVILTNKFFKPNKVMK